METLLRLELPKLGQSFSVADVDSNQEWKRRFGNVIPVLLRDGKPVAKVRLDAERLESIVRGRRTVDSA
jgi:hypothetical protein